MCGSGWELGTSDTRDGGGGGLEKREKRERGLEEKILQKKAEPEEGSVEMEEEDPGLFNDFHRDRARNGRVAEKREIWGGHLAARGVGCVWVGVGARVCRYMHLYVCVCVCVCGDGGMPGIYL